ncbi:selenocysteine-specific translation elongation factor [Fimbriimonas ginsengisoli]|uniref:Selenocysteine-specific elongation factor n=1 Tax=Fimbriimonas ginsengisoli Gsoil 348 TaxID=661478 RepID=A0A068NJY4_FIMGI|nr:selenocysteine-specific translation elongation factor [Fimbriimonas ginsengisoli]AIE83903.1 selenocysteine-specific translation elongation factor [Fimbriimonas ginsengisoli Gsoil 348]
MAKLIGTAGHVDHGKTTLIKALTGIDADRLPEEKERGMTIDVGFAYLDLPEVGRVSIVDVPGHERFLTNMLVGALGIDVALLCVSADEAVMPQSREHLQILELLPVEHLVVAMTRADLADPETRELAQAEIEELVAGSRFGKAPIVPVSAFTGEGLEELKSELVGALNAPSAKRPNASAPWYLPIDRAFSAKGHGVVVTGTLAQGRVSVGDRAYLEPGHWEVRVRGIQTHGEAEDSSERGQRTGLNLSGVKLEDVRRGMTLGAPGAVFETSMLDARVQWIKPPKHGERIRLSIGAEEVIGKAFLNDADPELAQLRLESPIACALDQPLILRRYSPPRLMGGGRVTVPQAKVRRKKEETKKVEAQDLGTAVVETVGDDPNGVSTEEICRRLGKTPQALGDVFEQLREKDRLRGFAGLWMTPEGFEAGADRFMAALTQQHSKTPTLAGIPRERAVQGAGLGWNGKPLDRIISELAARGKITVSGTAVRDIAYKPQLPTRQREFLDRAIEAMERETVNVPGPHDIAKTIVAPPQAIEEVLRLGVQAGELVQVFEGVFYTVHQIEALKARLKDALGTKPFPASEARDALGTSRKYIIPLLEYMDSVRFTIRVGDNRVIRG